MNLLNSGQNNDLQKRILLILSQIGINQEEKEAAEQFFDFSKPADLSLLDGLKCRLVTNTGNHYDSYMLFNDLLRLPKEKSEEYTNRYVLFLDAIAGNTIGRFTTYGAYFYHYNESDLCIIRRAYEQKYAPADVEPKLAAFVACGLNADKSPFGIYLVQTAIKAPRILYKAGKDFCYEEQSFSRARLYSLAMAYGSENDFSADESEEMENYLLTKEKNLSIQYSADLENIVLMLFLSANYGNKIKKRLLERMKQHSDQLLSALIHFIPADYFENNMELLNEILPDIEKAIKRTIQSAAVSEAFRVPQTNWQTKNSIHFLEFLARRYTEKYIKIMSLNESVGVGANMGYYFDYYAELGMILQRAVPDIKEKYSFDIDDEVVRMVVQREAMGIKSDVRKEVMDYLNGKTDISTLLLVRSSCNYTRGRGSMQHSIKMLKLLKCFPSFYSRYIAYKIIQDKDCLKNYITDMFRGMTEPFKDPDAVEKTLREFFGIAASGGVPLQDRIQLFERTYIFNDYWECRRTALSNALVAVMVQNAEKYDTEYAVECPKGEVITRCCYAKYLEKTNEDNRNKDRLLALCEDSSKEVRRTVGNIISRHKEYETEVLGMLLAKKQTIRECAVDIIALWGVENYREQLTKAADTEKSAKLAEKMRAMLTSSVSSGNNGESLFSPVTFIEDIHKGGRARKVAWLFESPLPTVHFKNGSPADEKYLQALILCYSSMTTIGRNENALLLAAELNETELQRFSAEIFSRWHSVGAETKTKWAMYFSVIHGGDAMIEIALKCIKDWSENMRGAIAAEAVHAIALNGSSFALMAVDNLAHKFKQKQVKKAAAEAMDSAAEALGITADELGDRIVPDLGFDEKKERIFDYGQRTFKVRLSARLELEVFDESGKRLKNLPAPAKKDDETLAKQSSDTFKALKKQLKNVIALQKQRLETALMADRRWKKSAWVDLFVKNPVMHSFAIGLIWAAYGDGETTTFRYMEDGTFNTSDEDEFTLPEECTIGLVHPVELDDELIASWQEQLSDYEIVQPVEQLERKLYCISENEYGKLDLERFRGRTINALSLLGRATKLGWSKGSVQDAGMFYVFYREDITEKSKNPDGSYTVKGNAAELHFSGAYVSVENEEVTIENVRFYHPSTIQHGSYIYEEADNEKAIPLDKIPPRYFSEIILQLEALLS